MFFVEETINLKLPLGQLKQLQKWRPSVPLWHWHLRGSMQDIQKMSVWISIRGKLCWSKFCENPRWRTSEVLPGGSGKGSPLWNPSSLLVTLMAEIYTWLAKKSRWSSPQFANCDMDRIPETLDKPHIFSLKIWSTPIFPRFSQVNSALFFAP